MNKIKKMNEYFFPNDGSNNPITFDQKKEEEEVLREAGKGAALNFLGEVNTMIDQFNGSTENLDGAYNGLCDIMSKYMEIPDFKEFLKHCEGKFYKD